MLDLDHPFYPTFRQLMTEAAARNPVYDLGTSARFAKEVGMVRTLFDETNYLAGGYKAEMIFGTENCDFDCDIQNLSGITDGEAGSVLCISVLEHVVNPWLAVREIYRILQPGGLAVASMPFLYAYHGKKGHIVNPIQRHCSGYRTDSTHNGYGDFWRFTHEGLGVLFFESGFDQIDIFPVDGWLISRIQISGLYSVASRIPGLMSLLRRFDRPRLGKSTSMHFVRAKKAI